MAEKDETTNTEPSGDGKPPKNPKGIRFWGTFVAMCILAFLSALDASIITIALPTIVEDIGGGTQYVWIANSFVVAACVVQPLLGHLADTFGRRIPMVCVPGFLVLPLRPSLKIFRQLRRLSLRKTGPRDPDAAHMRQLLTQELV